MTTHIIARFADGKMLIQETQLANQQTPYGVGIKVRMGHVGHITKVLSVTTDLERFGAVTPLALISSALDVVTVRMFRGDFAAMNAQTSMGSGLVNTFSGCAALNTVSGFLSGLLWCGEVLSGTPVSGLVTVTVNAIGY